MSPRAWVDRHTRVVTDILCFRATSQGSFARPVTRVYASARWAALRMTNAKNSRLRWRVGPFELARVANLMPLPLSAVEGRAVGMVSKRKHPERSAARYESSSWVPRAQSKEDS